MKKSFIIGFSALALALGGYLVAYACGGGYYGEYVRFSIFNRSLPENTAFAPFYFTSEFLYAADGTANQAKGIEANVQEWAAALGLSAADSAHIRRVVYERTEKDAERWVTNITQKKTDPREAKSVLMQAVSKNPTLKGVPNYLWFAKKCEGAAHTYAESDSWEEKPKKQNKYTPLIAEGAKMYAAETNDFLKQRIGYQLVMLNRYNAGWKDCKTTFEKYIANSNRNSVVYWWAMAHYGTAHYWLGDTAKANFYLAQVFMHDDYKRGRMYLGFTGEQTEKTLAFCKNNDEKIAVLGLTTFKKEDKSLNEIKNIAAIDLNAPLLETLLVREVNKVEDWVLSPRIIGLGSATSSISEAESSAIYNRPDVDYDLQQAINVQNDEAYAKKMYEWVGAQTANKTLKNTALWNVSAAHLAFICNDFAKAETFLQQAEKSEKPLSKALTTQIHLTRIMARMNFDLQKGMSDDDLLTEIKWMRAERDANTPAKNTKKAEEYNDYDTPAAEKQYAQLMLAMAQRAESQKNHTKQAAFLAQAQTPYKAYDGDFASENDAFTYVLDAQTDAKSVEAVIKYASETPKNELQTILAEPIKKHLNRLWDIVGTKYLREDKLEESLKAYQNIPKNWFPQGKSGYYLYTGYMQNDPFEVNNTTLGATKTYSRTEFVSRLLELKKALAAATAPSKQSALDAYQLGCAYYNIGNYDGNAWARTHYWKSTGMTNGLEFEYKNQTQKPLKRAIDAFAQAEKWSANLPAFKAICVRMIGQCEWYEAIEAFRATNKIYDKPEPSLIDMPTIEKFGKMFDKKTYDDLVTTCDGWQRHLNAAK